MKLQDIYKYAKLEKSRQSKYISLIASENQIFPEALEIAKYPLTNKYSEGYPGRRFYSGCENIDSIENYAIEAAKKLFKCSFANVQCFSGSIANQAIYSSLLKLGDTILSLEMSSGGHLTHSSSVSFVSKLYKLVTYSVDPVSFKLDYSEIRKIALKSKPKLIIVGGSSYPFPICFKSFRQIADEVGAFLFADICHLSGLIVTGLHDHCFPHAHVAMCTTHKQLRGARGALILWNDGRFSTINKSVFPGLQGGMNPVTITQNAVALTKCLDQEYRDYMSDVVEFSNILSSSLRDLGAVVIGKDTHMFLLDTKKSYGLSGKESSDLLYESGISVNPNLLPFDNESPLVCSGIRIGTLWLATLSVNKEKVCTLAKEIHKILKTRIPSFISLTNA